MDHEDELLLNTLVKVSPVSIEVVDIKNRELVCSSGWTSKHLGYSEKEFFELSRNLFEKLVHPEDRALQLKTYESLFCERDASFKDVTLRVIRKDGAYDYIQIRLAILEVDEQNKPRTVLSIVTDVGEIITLREKLQRQLEKMDIISFKNSHDLRGPVATILGLVNLIEHDQFDGAHSVEIIRSLKKTVIKLDEVIHEINTQTYEPE